MSPSTHQLCCCTTTVEPEFCEFGTPPATSVLLNVGLIEYDSSAPLAFPSSPPLVCQGASTATLNYLDDPPDGPRYYYRVPDFDEWGDFVSVPTGGVNCGAAVPSHLAWITFRLGCAPGFGWSIGLATLWCCAYTIEVQDDIFWRKAGPGGPFGTYTFFGASGQPNLPNPDQGWTLPATVTVT